MNDFIAKEVIFSKYEFVQNEENKEARGEKKAFARLLGYWEDKIDVLNYKVGRERRTKFGGIFINSRLIDSNRYRYFSTNPNKYFYRYSTKW